MVLVVGIKGGIQFQIMFGRTNYEIGNFVEFGHYTIVKNCVYIKMFIYLLSKKKLFWKSDDKDIIMTPIGQFFLALDRVVQETALPQFFFYRVFGIGKLVVVVHSLETEGLG